MTDTDRPRTELTEETHETLHVLELDRTPLQRKIVAERAYFDGAHEVRFTERTFRPRHGASLDDVRAFVDSLEVHRRAVPPLPQAPATVPAHVPAKIPDHYREPLERVIRGGLISVDTVHRVGSGTVVDVAWESEDEGERRGLYVIEDDAARPYDSVASRVDELPPPRLEATQVSMPEPDRSAPDAPAKKGLLGRFGKQKPAVPSAASPPARPPPAEPQPEEPKKKRFGFGRGK